MNTRRIRFLATLAVAALLGVSALAEAQRHGGGGGGGGGGGMHGGSGWGYSGGNWGGGNHGGGGWHGGGYGGGHWGHGHGGYYGNAWYYYGAPLLFWGAFWPWYYYDYYSYPYPYSYDYSYYNPNAYNYPYVPPRGGAAAPESGPPASGLPSGAQWYCPDRGYYPSIVTCVRPWLRVIPEPAG